MTLADLDTTGAPDAAPNLAGVVPAEAIRVGTRGTLRFEGRDHGSAISYFLVNAEPGQGPDLHRHPYPETWIVFEGEARFTVGGEQFIATAGDTATCAAGLWHGFKNAGTGRLKVLGIHPSDTIIQENADEVGA
ncbi:cupin domain-containing protein [Agromyces sp. H66]|uniref:cupin domain-containing protein n=1 Tax=Agromyces sp. H66 TaxID=2529859 RepID=UPI0010AABF85|nr:cupin domain-containing protein [Agromyces sp. H66]